jgi:pimeloyl-ACP methyl ester carboxylesterase
MSLKIKLLSFIFLLLSAVSVFAQGKYPTFVFVHGAMFNSSVWMTVQSRLQNANANVITIDVPGRADDGMLPAQVTLDAAADKLCKVAGLQEEPVVLVGHSQGGAVITQAIDKCADNIKALVYIAAVAPLNGETVFQDLSKEDNNNFDMCVTLDKSRKLYRVNTSGPIAQMFMADLEPDEAELAIENMVPEPTGIGDSKLHYSPAAFKSIPKFYIETRKDKIISLATQKKIERKIRPNRIYSMDTSHTPFFSQPYILSNYLLDIGRQNMNNSF